MKLTHINIIVCYIQWNCKRYSVIKNKNLCFANTNIVLEEYPIYSFILPIAIVRLYTKYSDKTRCLYSA